MKPTNVITHKHFFPINQDVELEINRFDVCGLQDGSIVIWDVDKNIITDMNCTFEEAFVIAQEMADYAVRNEFLNAPLA